MSTTRRFRAKGIWKVSVNGVPNYMTHGEGDFIEVEVPEDGDLEAAGWKFSVVFGVLRITAPRGLFRPTGQNISDCVIIGDVVQAAHVEGDILVTDDDVVVSSSSPMIRIVSPKSVQLVSKI